MLHFGWTPEERSKPQPIVFDFAIALRKTPKACKSDQLKDTLCYDTLMQAIRKLIQEKNKDLKLLEHLCFIVYKQLKKEYLKNAAELCVRVTKNFQGTRAAFIHGDFKWSF